jgi:hypothetical protein
MVKISEKGRLELQEIIEANLLFRLVKTLSIVFPAIPPLHFFPPKLNPPVLFNTYKALL